MQDVFFLIAFIVLFVLALKRRKKARRIENAPAVAPVAAPAVALIDSQLPEAPMPLNIIDRNIETITAFLAAMTLPRRYDSYRDANTIRDCINKIAIKENHAQFRYDCPPYPGEYKQLEQFVKTATTKRWTELRADENQKQLARRDETLQRHKELVDKFLIIAERKVSVLDDYGEENWSVLPKEIEICLKKMGEKENDPQAIKLRYELHVDTTLESRFREYHEAKKLNPTVVLDFNKLSGIEFETHVGRIMKSAGYEVAGTPATGDQGADLIATKDGKTLIIQAKRYQGKVGNKAVQEVIAALSYYSGDEGWVVTNSTFTPSAVALAQKSGVRLVDGLQLQSDWITEATKCS
jgi:hypothetical protein